MITAILFKNKRFSTIDGKYFTKTDDKSFSYWYDENSRLPCHSGYDYCFCVNTESAKESALNLLNKLLS